MSDKYMPEVTFLDDHRNEALITVRWRRWFGLVAPRIVIYQGSGTVWHDAKSGRRQPTHREMRLAEWWIGAKRK